MLYCLRNYILFRLYYRIKPRLSRSCHMEPLKKKKTKNQTCISNSYTKEYKITFSLETAILFSALNFSRVTRELNSATMQKYTSFNSTNQQFKPVLEGSTIPYLFIFLSYKTYLTNCIPRKKTFNNFINNKNSNDSLIIKT